MTETDPLQPHSHANNSEPPSADPSIELSLPSGRCKQLTLTDLSAYQQTSFSYSYQTDHGVHGPYLLSGVALRDLLQAEYASPFREVEVWSVDRFGNRIYAAELTQSPPLTDPILLCTSSDGRPLTRANGLVRLVVPSETDNALRQVKWVAKLIVKI